MPSKSKPVLSEYNAAKTGGILEFLSRNMREMFLYRHALYNFVNTNLSSRYRRSTIGFLWSLLNPLFTMAIIALVFSSLYKLPFSEFSMYLFSGSLPWNLITASLLGGSMSIISNETYLKKVYIPKILFPMVTLGVEMTNFFFSLVSLIFLALLLGANLGWSLLLIPFALLLLSLFILGLIMLVSIITVFFRDLSHILQIVLLGLFYLTPILYPLSLLSPEVQDIVELNPFYYFITLFHIIIYEAASPKFSDWLPCIIFTIISLVVGIFVFQRKENDVIYRL